MEPVNWLPDVLSYPLYWIYLDQTIIAGAVAAIAAWITVRAIRDQISQQGDLENERIRRRSRAYRATLPYALYEFGKYTEESMRYAQKIQVWLDDHERLDGPDRPLYPEKGASRLSDAIEYCTPNDAKKLAGILASAQIYDSRFDNFVQQFREDEGSLTADDFRTIYFDGIGLKKLIDRAYDFGRGRELFIGEVCEVDAAINSLRIILLARDEVLGDKLLNLYWLLMLSCKSKEISKKFLN